MLIINLIILVFFSALADAKGCTKRIPVMNGGNLEKTLCYVNKDLTWTAATTYCKNQNMQLYRPKSSQASWNTLAKFGREFFGNNKKSEVFISGRVGSSQCRVLRGDGTLDDILCASASKFICQERGMMPQTTTPGPAPTTTTTTTTPPPTNAPIPCTEHVVSTSFEPHIDVSGISTPTTCEMFGLDFQPADVIISNIGIDKNNIHLFYISARSTVVNLPIYLSTSFPELRAIEANSCGITTLRRETFQGLTKLTYLALNGNSITTLSTNVFQDLTKLAYLLCEDCPLTTISSGFFSTLLPVLRSVGLESAGCINEVILNDRNSVAALPGPSATCATE